MTKVAELFGGRKSSNSLHYSAVVTWQYFILDISTPLVPVVLKLDLCDKNNLKIN